MKESSETTLNEKLITLTKGLPVDELEKISDNTMRKSTIQTMLIFGMPVTLAITLIVVAVSIVIQKFTPIPAMMTDFIPAIDSVILLILLYVCIDRYWLKVSLRFYKKQELKELQAIINRNNADITVLELRETLYLMQHYELFENLRKQKQIITHDEALEAVNQAIEKREEITMI